MGHNRKSALSSERQTDRRRKNRAPYDLETDGTCQTYKLSTNGFYCQLPVSTMKDFSAIQTMTLYPEGALLFFEGDSSHGIFLLCSGQVKLSTCVSESRILTVGIATAGELLGLMAVLTNTKYEITAKTYQPSQIAYIRREDFLQFMKNHPEAYPGVIWSIRG